MLICHSLDKKINIKCSIIRVWSGILSLIIKSFLLCSYRYPSMNVFNKSFNADWFSSAVLFGLTYSGWLMWKDERSLFFSVPPTLKFLGPKMVPARFENLVTSAPQICSSQINNPFENWWDISSSIKNFRVNSVKTVSFFIVHSYGCKRNYALCIVLFRWDEVGDFFNIS